MSLQARLETYRRAIRGWGFVGFSVLAGSLIGFTLFGRWRIERAARELAVCAATADTKCATRALEKVRVLDASDPRSRVGQAQIHALLGEADKAEQVLRSELPDANISGSNLAELLRGGQYGRSWRRLRPILSTLPTA